MPLAQSPVAGSRGFENTFETAFSIFLEHGDRSALVDYLLARSNLPGPRANLELLQRFAERVGRNVDSHAGELWGLCISFVNIPHDKSIAGGPMEFIPMCGTVGIGALAASSGSTQHEYFDESMARLRAIADDPRWRVRESVAIALQKLLASSKEKTVQRLTTWVEPERWLRMRAVVAGIAEPPLLRDTALCRQALALHRTVITYVVDHLRRSNSTTVSEVMKSEPFRKLIQALEYSLSVVVAADPDEGFPFLSELAEIAMNRHHDPGLATAASVARKIIKGNLKKKRLSRPYPRRVEELMRTLE